MFQRGQKVIVIESSAKGGVHPKVGDIGYLDNMYLLPTDRLILSDIIFFAYKSDIKKNKNRVEKKRLIIDLGMKRDLRYRITKAGIPRTFFHPLARVCLTSVGYLLPIEHNNQLDTSYSFVDYPRLIGLHGIWARDVNREGKHLSKNPVIVPCGNIASFSSCSNRKYPMEDCSADELSAWIQTMNPIMSAMWSTFFKAGVNKQVEYIWRHVEGLFEYKYYRNKVVYTISKKFSNISTDEKALFIANIRQLGLLNNMMLSCLDVAFFSRLDGVDTCFGDLIATEWSRSGIIDIASDKDRNDDRKIFLSLLQVVRSIFFRNVIMPGDIRRQLKAMHPCLPTGFSNSDKAIEAEMERFLEVQKAADNNSSALNRIFDSKLVS